MNLRTELESIVSAALQTATGQPGRPACVAPSAKPQFGDYQANGVMAAAKIAKTNPRQLAQTVLDELNKAGLDKHIEKVEIAGPGFLNITLSLAYINEQLNAIYADATARADTTGHADTTGATSPERKRREQTSAEAPGATAASSAAVPLQRAGSVSDGANQRDSRLGVDKPTNPQTVVVDYSAPNLAKEMHVGHLRSTIIGDALARTLAFIGHEVIRQNHVGDWGTQFGMLVAHSIGKDDQFVTARFAQGHTSGNYPPPIADLEERYRQAKALFDSSPEFAERSRQYVVKLQTGDENTLMHWRTVVRQSLSHCEIVYNLLDVLLDWQDVRGESFYGGVDLTNASYDPAKNMLPAVIADLKKLEMLESSQGAMCVFLDEFKGKDGLRLPLIVQKSDEGYLYATTDLAAIRYRANELRAHRILYVVDARQTLHFRQLFAVARKAGFVPQSVSLEHIAFGTMMGADGKPFKTRTGGTVKLMDMLDEAVKKAKDLITQRNSAEVAAGKAAPLPPEKIDAVANIVGIGAVKYADLSQNRNSDYVFSWDKMLSLDGNTAPYMQYAYARIQSIFRKAGLGGTTGEEGEMASAEIRNPALGAAPEGAQSAIRNGSSTPIAISQPAERSLAVKLLQFPETISMLASECLPNFLCAYLYDLAGAFTRFYEDCPVLKSEEPTRTSRLALCRLTGAVIKKGLELLGIQTIDQM